MNNNVLGANNMEDRYNSISNKKLLITTGDPSSTEIFFALLSKTQISSQSLHRNIRLIVAKPAGAQTKSLNGYRKSHQYCLFGQLSKHT